MIGPLTRRSFVYGSAVMLAVGQSGTPVRDVFDHLLFGVSDLDHGIDWFRQRAGVAAATGGIHPGRGTRNALVSLGGVHYLEIIAPDPAQSVKDRQYQLSTLTEPRLINFAVRTNDMDATVTSLRASGVQMIGPSDGSRRTPSGELLRWKTLGVVSNFQAGEVNPIPFFIEWANNSAHPSKSAPAGCVIEDLRFEHPRGDELGVALRAIGLDAKVTKADHARIIAILQTPRGRLQLV